MSEQLVGRAVDIERDTMVLWDGTAFAGMLIDRRPLLIGGSAMATHVVNWRKVDSRSAAVFLDRAAPPRGEWWELAPPGIFAAIERLAVATASRR